MKQENRKSLTPDQSAALLAIATRISDSMLPKNQTQQPQQPQQTEQPEQSPSEEPLLP